MASEYSPDSSSDRHGTLARWCLCFACITVLGVILPKATPSGIAVQYLSMPNVDQGAVAVMAGVVGYVREAVTAVQEERQGVVAERDAFDRFVREIEDVPAPSQSTLQSQASAVAVAGIDRNERQLRSIRETYRNTVMRALQFEDEALRENMAAEFTESIANAVLDGRQFSRPLKQELIRQAIEARRRRDVFIETLTHERDSLEVARDRLRRIDRHDATAGESLADLSPSELAGRDRELRRGIDRCERLLEDRQRHVHAQNERFSRFDLPFLQGYLYTRLPVSFPVLVATLEEVRRLRDRRRDVLRSVVRRD